MAKPMNLYLLHLLHLLLFFFYFSSPTNAAYNVVDYGAKPDGETDSTKSFLNVWTLACGSPKPQTIRVPTGRFLLDTVLFKGPCKNTAIKFWIDGTLVAPSNSDASSYWIKFDGVEGLSIYGGTLDGQGSALWSCKMAGRSCPLGPTSLNIGHAKNVLINGLTSINSKLFHMQIHGSDGVTVQGVKLIAPDESPNTDGIHVMYSTGVTITGSTMKTGDDCISIGPGTSNLWIERINCGPGHGISIGSLGHELEEEGVQNVTVKTVVFTQTQNGLRLKTWARPSNGFVKGVTFQHVVMKNVKNPIVIDQNYCPGIKNCPNQSSGIKISQVKFSDIKGSSATQVAMSFDCSQSNPCRGIGLEDIKLTYQNQPAQSYCKYADGTTSGSIVPQSCL